MPFDFDGCGANGNVFLDLGACLKGDGFFFRRGADGSPAHKYLCSSLPILDETLLSVGLHGTDSLAHIGKDVVDDTLGRDLQMKHVEIFSLNDLLLKSTHAGTLAGVGVDDGLGMLVEGIQALLDGFHVVVNAATGLTALEQPLSHGCVANVEVKDLGARADLLFKLLALEERSGRPCRNFSLKALPEPPRVGIRR